MVWRAPAQRRLVRPCHAPMPRRNVAAWERRTGASEPPLRQLSRLRRPRRAPSPSLEEQIEALFAERRFKDAIPLAEQLVANAERAHGANHADVADALGVLSDAESGAGQTARAVSSLERAIAIREQAIGRDHADVAQDLNALAVLYYGQGNYKAAEPLMTRALSIRERALGPDAPETAQSVNNLAQLYQEMGDYAAAEPLLQRALAIVREGPRPQSRRRGDRAQQPCGPLLGQGRLPARRAALSAGRWPYASRPTAPTACRPRRYSTTSG